MAFLLYFIVILVSAASVLFGLDLATSPLPPTPNVPIGRSAQVAPAHATKPVREAKRDADTRALTPVYPTRPGVPNAEAQTAPAQTNDSATSSRSTPSRQAPSAPPEQPAPAAPPPQQQAGASPASTQPPPTKAATALNSAAPEPTVAQSKAHCDVQACAAAYHSFRASDCSYQPYPRVRQVCTRTGGAASAAVRPPPSKAVYPARRLQPPLTARQASDTHEVDEVTRIVRKMTRGEDGDVAVQDSQGRIIIVHPGSARAYAPYD